MVSYVEFHTENSHKLDAFATPKALVTNSCHQFGFLKALQFPCINQKLNTSYGKPF
jgi:hypothetical protein